MAEMLRIRSANEYFKEFGVDGIGKGADKWMIRRQLIDAFQKEMFGLIKFRIKGIYPNEQINKSDPALIDIVRKVASDTQKKWIKLCKMFDQYEETRNLLKIDDLKHGELEEE